MNDLISNAIARPALLVILGCALCGMLLRIFSTVGRRELQTMWFFNLIGLVVVVAANVTFSRGVMNWANAFEIAATGLAVLGALQIACVLVFQLVMPALGLAGPRIAQDLAFMVSVMASAIYGLSQLGVDPSKLFTTSAILTAVLAFAMQDTLGNVLGGVVLQLDNSLKVGDFVRVDTITGTVVDVRWRYTAIETNDREVVILPNSALMKQRFHVLRPRNGEPLVWRRTLHFNIDPNATAPHVIAVMNKAVADSRITLVSATRPASTVLADVTAGYCRYALRYWLTEPEADSSTDSLVRIHVVAALVRANIRFGAPQEQRQVVDESAELQRQAAIEHGRRLVALQRASLFAGLSQSEREALATCLVRAPFVKGSVMTRQGAVAHWLYLIVDGQASVVLEQGGQMTAVSNLKEGDFFGEMGMLTGAPRSATVLAVTDVESYRLDKNGFAEVLLQRPDIAVEISQVLEQRQRELANALRQNQASQPVGKAEEMLVSILGFFGIRESS
ncbi:MAG: mechanosensitive ion channel [Burkholderiales bacterium]|nr:mechanosensitive ion channel [Burkholderiales bacterium]